MDDTNNEILLSDELDQEIENPATSEVLIPEFMNETPLSDVAQNRLAASMALAELRNGPAEVTYAQHYTRMKAKLAEEGGGIEGYRSELAQKKFNEKAMSDLGSLGISGFGNADRYTLEEEATDQLTEMAVTDDESFETIMQEDWGDFIRDHNVKRQIIQNEIDRLEARMEGSSKLTNVVNFLATFIPYNQSRRDVGGMSLLSGQKILEKRAALFDLPLEDFKKEFQNYVSFLETDGMIFGDNPTLNKQALETLLDFGSKDVKGHTFWTLFDAADLAITPAAVGVKAAGRALRKSVSMSENVLNGMADINRPLATDTAVERVLRAQNGETDVDAVVRTVDSIDQLLPSYVSGTLSPSVGLSGDMLRSLEATQGALAEVLRARDMNSRLTPDEIQLAFDATRTRLLKQFKPGEIKDIKIHSVDDMTGINKVSVVLGRADGKGGYAHERSAKSAAKNRGISNAQVFRSDDGMYYIQQLHDLPEEGFVLGMDPNSIRGFGFISPVLNPHTWIAKRTSVAQQVASGQKDRITRAINENIVPKLSKLSTKDRQDLSAVMAKGMDEEKWYNLTELKDVYERYRGRVPTEKEVEAYYTMKTLNDFDWTIRNNTILMNKARRGHETVSIPKHNYEGTGKVITEYADAGKFRVLNLSDNHYYERGQLTRQDLDEMLKDGKYKLISLDEPMFRQGAKDDIPIQLVLVKRGDVDVSPLNPVQLSYRAGGHRMYAPNQYFVKQSFIGEMDNGTKFMLDPIVHTASESREELLEWTARMESARVGMLEYKAGRLSEREVRPLLQDANIRDVDHWNELVASKAVRENTPFEVVRDGERPITGLAEGTYDDLRDQELWMDDLSRYASHTNKPFTGKRGDILVGPDGEKVKTLDPFETANKAIENAIKTGAYYDYRVTQVEAWARGALPYMKAEARSVPPSEVFSKPESYWLDNVDNTSQVKLMAARRNIERQLGMRTFADRKFDTMKQSLADWVEGTTGGRLSQATVKGALDIASDNTIQRVRSLAYDLYLGLLNPAQIFLQVQTSAAIASMSPRMGSKAILNYPAMRAVWNSSDEFLERFAKEQKDVASVGGMDPSEFVLMMKELNRSGLNNVSEGFSLLGDVTPSVSGRVGGAIKATRRGGRYFLTEAERMNTGVAWGTAWREYAERFPGKSPTSPEARRWILDRANTLNMDMRNHSKSALQEGPQALAFQFAQYQIHLLQNMLGGSARGLSKDEQARLFIGQVLLYGGGGFGGSAVAEFIGEKYHEATGEPMNDIVWKQLSSGILDASLYAVSGGELSTDFGSRAGVFGWVEQMSKMWSDKSVLEIAGGAGSPALTGLAGSILRNVKFMSDAVMHENLTGEDVKTAMMDIARSASSFSVAERAYLMATTGVDLAKSGVFQGGGRTELQAMATLIGIPLSEINDAWTNREFLTDRKERVSSVVKLASGYAIRASLEDDPKVKESYSKMIATLLKGLGDPLMEQEALEGIASRLPRDFYINMAAERWVVDPNSPLANQPRLREERKQNGVQ